MEEKQLKVTTLRQALALAHNAGRPLVRLEVFAAARHAELWIKDGETIVLAHLQPDNVYGWQAVYPLLELSTANFVLAEPAQAPDFAPPTAWLKLADIPQSMPKPTEAQGSARLEPQAPPVRQSPDDDILDRLGTILGTQPSDVNAIQPGPQNQIEQPPRVVPQTESQRLVNSISNSSRRQFALEEDAESRGWLKRQMKRLTARARRAAQSTFISQLRLGADKDDSGQESDSIQNQANNLNPKTLLGIIPPAVLVCTAVAVTFIGLGYWALSEQAKSSQSTEAIDFQNATRFAEEQSLTASEEKPQKAFPLPAGSSGPQGGGSTAQGDSNSNKAPEYPSYYSTTEVEDLRSIVHGGENLMARGGSEPALNIYLKGLEKYPESVRLRLAAARAYLALGKPNEARLMCLTGIQVAVNQDDAQVLKAFAISIP